MNPCSRKNVFALAVDSHISALKLKPSRIVLSNGAGFISSKSFEMTLSGLGHSVWNSDGEVQSTDRIRRLPACKVKLGEAYDIALGRAREDVGRVRDGMQEGQLGLVERESDSLSDCKVVISLDDRLSQHAGISGTAALRKAVGLALSCAVDQPTSLP